MQLFYFPELHEGITSVQLEGDEVHHITKVLRKQSGDVLHLTNGLGGYFEAGITDVRKHHILVDIRKAKKMPEPYYRGLTLVMGVIKQRERLEFAVEKAVEIGVGRIVMFHADRSERSRVNVSRIENIMISAMKQSMQVYLPALVEVDSAEEVCSLASGGARMLVADEQVTTGHEGMAFLPEESVVLVVGPEGGLTDRELDVFQAHGAGMMSLGTTRQRAETAAITMLSAAHLGYAAELRQGGIPLYGSM